MILVVIVIRVLAINRLPKKTFTALWGIVLLQLLVPFSFPSPFSVYSLVNGPIPASQGAAGLVFPGLAVGLPSTEAVFKGQAEAVISPYVVLWGIGMIVSASFFTVSYVKFLREFRESLPVKNAYLTKWIAEHRRTRTIEIRQSSRIPAPLTYGIFKPIILMPNKTEWDDTKQIAFILEHEYIHVRRFDAAAKLFLTAALCIHWFNPLVWAMYRLSNRDIELSCDETVVRLFGDTTRSAYARTLVSMEEKKITRTPLCNNFSKNAIEERIEAIMKIKKVSIAAVVVSLSLIGGVSTVFGTSAPTNPDLDNISTETGTVMVRKPDDDGPDLYSIDDGATWISEADYHAMYPQDEIVWWTYNEYKHWLEEYSSRLQSYVGSGARYAGSDGQWTEWTQDHVNAAIQREKETLESIKNGARVSKTVNGADTIVMVSDPLADGDIGVSYGAAAADQNGETFDLGNFDSKEERLAAVEQYCEKQVKDGKMSQEEADRFIKGFE